MRNNLKDLLEILDKAYPNSIPIRTLNEHKHEIVVINDAIKNKLVDKITIPSLTDDPKLNNKEMALKLSFKGHQYLEKIKVNRFWTFKNIPIVAIIALIIAGATFFNDQSESRQPKLSVIDYTVVYNEKYFKPIFNLENVGNVPLKYEVNKSDITGISFYNGSNLFLRINARQITTTDFVYHNRGELLLPEAKTQFSFTSTNLQKFKLPYTRFETNISLSIKYWNVDYPSKICTFYSEYTFFSNENKIYPIPNTQSWACN
ncbi:MAG: hypothetical protein KAT05_02655 [Spirochaetes bacterium]|nr:hypothetical protein [Spirochaetota bacterium]